MDVRGEKNLIHRGFSQEDVSVLAVYGESWPITPPETPICSSSDGTAVNTPSRPIQDPDSSCLDHEFETPKGRRGHCSLLSKREKRKRYRQKKKVFHRLGKERWESLAEARLQQRWSERSRKVHTTYLAELEKRRKKENDKIAHDVERKEAIQLEQIRCNERMHCLEEQYHVESSQDNTGPLLLDSVLVPIQETTLAGHAEDLVHTAQCIEHVESARSERNQALRLVQHYRNLAEEYCREKRDLQYKLEAKIELVRDFWRNQVVEGGSRSGKILRAALIRK